MKTFDELNLTKSADGLIPAVIQDDDSLRVLMLGYMNQEAYERTCSSGLVTFWSRSRGRLWVKGETSGNCLHVCRILADCDADTLLVRVHADGPTCHRGTTSCFDTEDSEGFVRTLQRVVQQRHAEMPDGHYTTHLFAKGVNKIAQKVGEEAVETVIEAIDGNRERYIYEAGDLIYHLLVLNEQMGCTLADLERELMARHK
ncbi:MAG: bifunctional phosphoribosyl-AMP cyclohydrolase/phosphoribosyl-ATP diphosphatase HisIE [Paludibacteraceae bacterium]|nr:bifunctional phosphoribosyl-AMP cyclohydrolase/phosphoribosyl-ATP diphosphatase HisIE [Paludibacteraceae bacterium]